MPELGRIASIREEVNPAATGRSSPPIPVPRIAMLKIMDLSTSGLVAQRIRMTAIAGNLANITTTRNEFGELKPYDPCYVKFQTDNTIGPNGSAGVFVREIARDDLPPIRKYVPNHPDADEQGFINLPRINLVTEFTDAIESA